MNSDKAFYSHCFGWMRHGTSAQVSPKSLGIYCSPFVSLSLDGIQDHRDEGEDESMRRQRSLLLLSALASDALDEIAGLVKVS